METLPPEIVARIAAPLSNIDLALAASAGHAWRRVFSSPELWGDRDFSIRVGVLQLQFDVDRYHALGLQREQVLAQIPALAPAGASDDKFAGVRLLSAEAATSIFGSSTCTSLGRAPYLSSRRISISLEPYSAYVNDRRDACLKNLVSVIPASFHELELRLSAIDPESREAVALLEAMDVFGGVPQLRCFGLSKADADSLQEIPKLSIPREIGGELEDTPGDSSTRTAAEEQARLIEDMRRMIIAGAGALAGIASEIRTRVRPPFVHPLAARPRRLAADGQPSCSQIERLEATLTLGDWVYERPNHGDDIDFDSEAVAAFNMQLLESVLSAHPQLKFIKQVVVGEFCMRIELNGVGPSPVDHAALLNRMADAGIAVGCLVVEACSINRGVVAAIKRVVKTEPRCTDVRLKFVDIAPGVLTGESNLDIFADVRQLEILIGTVNVSNYDGGDFYWVGGPVEDDFLDWLQAGAHASTVQDLLLGCEWPEFAASDAPAIASAADKIAAAFSSMTRLNRLGLDFVTQWGLNFVDQSRLSPVVPSIVSALPRACPSLRRIYFPQMWRDFHRGDAPTAITLIMTDVVEACGLLLLPRVNCKESMLVASASGSNLWVELPAGVADDRELEGQLQAEADREPAAMAET